jgi:hypothetical protein
MKLPVEAEQFYREALSLEQALVDASPAEPGVENQLAGTLVRLAYLRNSREEFAGALELLRRARPHHQAALTARPKDPEVLQFYLGSLNETCVAHHRLGEHAALASTASELACVGFDPVGEPFAAATYMAVAVPLAERDGRLPGLVRSLLGCYYAQRAMGLLRQAVTAGFSNEDELRKPCHPLTRLRSRADFQELLKEVQRNARTREAERAGSARE